MSSLLRSRRTSSIIVALLSIVLGVVLIMYPANAANIFVLVCGYALIALGVYYAVVYFARKSKVAMIHCFKPEYRKFRKGDTVVVFSPELEYLCVLLTGRAHLYCVDSEGEDTLLEHYGPNDIFGEVFALPYGGLGYVVEADSDCEVMAQYQAGLKEYEAGKAQLAEYEAGQAKLAAAEKQLSEAKTKLDAGKAQLSQFEDGEKQVEDGKAELMITYGSYLEKKEDIQKNSVIVVCCDTMMAILAGCVVLPACAAFGLDYGGGPGLLFSTMQIVFSKMGGFIGNLMGFLFYFLVFLAALSSSISILEVCTAYSVDKNIAAGKGGKDGGRKKATILFAIGIFVFGLLVALDGLGSGVAGGAAIKTPAELFGIGVKGWNDCWLDFYDMISEGILMPLGAMVMTWM